MIFENNSFLVVGLSRSGISATKLLLSKGAKVEIYDDLDGEIIVRAKEELSSLGATVVGDNDIEKMVKRNDVIVLSPGIPIDNKLPLCARKEGKRIIGELELGQYFLRCPFIAVTGTNGKTTTVSIINEIISLSGKKSLCSGNIGVPLTSVCESIGEKDCTTIEVSSFQLETTHLFTPHIACLLNVTSDHLNRHYNMENYVFLKSKIFSNMRESEFAVLNYEDETCKKIASNLRCKKIFFSDEREVDGAYALGENIYFKGEKVLPSSSVKLSGKHNLQNVLCAVAVCKLLKIDNEIIEKGIREFKGVKHRIQFVKKVNEVSYYNDSKGTNTDSSIKAINSISGNKIIILGGSDKGENFDEYVKEIKDKDVKLFVLQGENKQKILESIKKHKLDNVICCPNFTVAFKVASAYAEENDSVLLSPASASFDAFNGYEERGNKFIELVEGLL